MINKSYALVEFIPSEGIAFFVKDLYNFSIFIDIDFFIEKRTQQQPNTHIYCYG